MLFDINKALYRKNNHGEPCVWYVYDYDHEFTLKCIHGILGKKLTVEYFYTTRDINAEIKSRINDKRKVGYKYLSEIKDNVELPVEETLLQYLNSYLPNYRTTADGTLLPMLAKTYDDKVFNKCDMYLGQYKINGLRCIISAEKNPGSIFNPIKLIFQSREGTYWNTLSNLEDYLLNTLPQEFLNRMLYEHIYLDGELYLPGRTINEINHIVKDNTCKENNLIQFWCYDLAIEDFIQKNRLKILYDLVNNNPFEFKSRESHLNNFKRFVVLPYFTIYNNREAVDYRNKFIAYGFEGLILRNPESEYQFGKRNATMIKYKNSTDGVFKIIDIYPEGVKRPNIPLILCQNDINDATFEVHLGGSQDFQKSVLASKDMYIGRNIHVEYGERSGVNQVPFHVKATYII